MNKILLTLFLLVFALPTFAEQHYTIGIKPAKPFSYKVDDMWKGVSVDLVNEMSRRQGFTYEFVETETITDLLSLAKDNKTDMVIGAISMTEEREKQFDFSHPYFTTTQGILVKQNGNLFVFVITRIGIAISCLLAVLYILGYIVSRLDPDDDINNVHKGAWFTLVTFTTTGYGDLVPRNAKAKVFAGIVMVVSLFALSAFTGYISSALTVQKLTDAPTTIQSLYNTKVLTIAGSTSQKLLENLNIKYETVGSFDSGVDAIEDGSSKAFIYDKAMLDYSIKNRDNRLEVWGIDSGYERYAIGFPTGSALRETINISILDIIDTTEWKRVLSDYFGS